jgi:predicted anti-sigma-YlaC factor YlaD
MKPDQELFDALEAETVDVGCAAGFEVLHQYVESQLSGGDPEHELPGVAAHLRSCSACRDDYSGLVEAATRFGNARPTAPPDQ